jgi:hypothetical protein
MPIPLPRPDGIASRQESYLIPQTLSTCCVQTLCLVLNCRFVAWITVWVLGEAGNLP